MLLRRDRVPDGEAEARPFGYVFEPDRVNPRPARSGVKLKTHGGDDHERYQATPAHASLLPFSREVASSSMRILSQLSFAKNASAHMSLRGNAFILSQADAVMAKHGMLRR
jgi:hypothetical protein